MEKLTLLYNHPVEGLFVFLGGAIASIFGSAIKDGIVKILSIFFKKYKKQSRLSNIKLHRQARMLTSDLTLLTLYNFRAMRMLLMWATTTIIFVLTAVLLQLKADNILLKMDLKLPAYITMSLDNADMVNLILFVIVNISVLILMSISGYVSSVRMRIIYRALNVRAKELGFGSKLP